MWELSGNTYHGLYFVKSKIPVSQDRAHPYILRSDIDNAIIFGSLSSYAQPLGGTVDRQFFRRPNLRVADVAQELLRNYPDKLLSEVASESGFISEKSFFRTFKDVTGVTPGRGAK